jgi:hypothetical protein
MRPSFLDDVSAAQARRRTRTACSRGRACGARARDGAGAVGHEMSRHYVLEYPVDDPDDEDDDVDDDDEDDDDEDGDEEEIETWQVSDVRRFR